MKWLSKNEYQTVNLLLILNTICCVASVSSNPLSLLFFFHTAYIKNTRLLNIHYCVKGYDKVIQLGYVSLLLLNKEPFKQSDWNHWRWGCIIEETRCNGKSFFGLLFFRCYLFVDDVYKVRTKWWIVWWMECTKSFCW